MDSIVNEVKDCDRIPANSQSLDGDQDHVQSLLVPNIYPVEDVRSQYEALRLDELKDDLRKGGSYVEDLATDDDCEPDQEKIMNMTPEEVDAAELEACQKSLVALLEVRQAVRQLGATKESRENYPMAVSEKMCSHQTSEETAEEVTAKFHAVLDAAKCTVKRSRKLIIAISEAHEKRPMTETYPTTHAIAACKL